MFKYTWLFLCFLTLLLPTDTIAAEKVPILVYHHIDEFQGVGQKELYVTPENFEKQIIYLRDHGFTLLTFEQWDEIDKVNKPVFLTFDDGYKNNWTVLEVFQKLKDERFQPRATFFVISGFIGGANRLSSSDLRELALSGLISVQSHSATHPDLTKMDDFKYELKGSRDAIQAITGQKVIVLAYPYGNFNQKVVKETKNYYTFGLTTTPDYFTKQGMKDERFLLPRIYVKHSTTMKDFADIVEGRLE